MRRALRIARRRRRLRAVAVAAAVGALALSAVSLGIVRSREAATRVDLSTAAPPSSTTARTRVLDLPGVHTPWAIAGDGGRSVWVLDRGGQKGPVVLRFDEGKAASTSQLPSDAAPEQIVVGTDGGLWMTDPAASRVLRVARDGRVSALPVKATPSASAVFAGERLYFAERGAGRITSVDAKGGILHQSLPSGTAPEVVSIGPDGSVWFGDAVRADVGSISASGVPVIYHLASPDERVLTMSPGPGPALWILVRSDHGLRLARVDGSGRIVEDDVEPSSAARALSQGPDGRLWFTSGDGTQLHRRSLASLSSIDIDRPVRARSWALSSDGTIWAVDADRNQVLEVNAP